MLTLSVPIFSAGEDDFDYSAWMPSPKGWVALAGAGSIGAMFFSQKNALAPLFLQVDRDLKDYELDWELAVAKFNETLPRARAGDRGEAEQAAGARPAPRLTMTDFTNYARDAGLLTESKVQEVRVLAEHMHSLEIQLAKKLKSRMYAISPIRFLINGRIVQLQQSRLSLNTIEPVLARLAACEGAEACLQRASVEFALHYENPTRWVVGQGKTLVDVHTMLTEHIQQLQQAILNIQSELRRLPAAARNDAKYTELEQALQEELKRAIHAARTIQQSPDYLLLARQRQ